MKELPLHHKLKALLLSPTTPGKEIDTSIGTTYLGLTNLSANTVYLSQLNPDAKGVIHFFLRDINKVYHSKDCICSSSQTEPAQ